MGLPDRLKGLRRRHVKSASTSSEDDSIFTQPPSYWYKLDLSRNTRSRRIFSLLAAAFYFLSFVFLLLVEIGNTNKSSKVLGDIYFFRLSLADIIPTSVENAELINSIARGLGLHDFYQPGLWNYCEGYDNEGITFCSKPQSYYWFDIVSVILNELLAGATIALPTELTQILNILKLCSHLMFAFFLAGTVLAFCLSVLSPVAIFSRWVSLPMSIISGLTFVVIFAGSVIASVISFVFKYAATAQSSLNIHANVGIKMFVFMWLATGFAFIAFILHAGMGCCCTSRRDLKTGRKPMRHSSMHRAMSQRSAKSQRSQSQRSQMTENTHARNLSAAVGSEAFNKGHNRNHTAFSFEQPTVRRSRSGTLQSMSDVPIQEPQSAVSPADSQRGPSSQISRSNTGRSQSGQVSRSGTVKSTTNGIVGGGGRSRSNTMRSIRFEDERPPSFGSDSTVVNNNSPDGVKESHAHALTHRHSVLPEEE
ncbi:SUR7/PalI family-domain-containing protein [Coniella lustricola]|uniref:SUR7/PalI family-domain-containing protein n=1 Tax=Coniella lustricola TaxID=2025994 RepID=A0A2T3A7G2_9PEZI|nr:SUR7/PalI family-domain-containing protein [Coniella lustricola]